MTITLLRGDNLEHMAMMADASIDAVVTDPPYNLSFMGKKWDNIDGSFQHWCEQWARECLRVLKPGGHMLAFGGSRTWHRLASGVEDAGFEMRDSIAWLYGNGFPKSMDVSRAIDKRPGVARHGEFKAELIAAREAAGLKRSDLAEFVVGTDSGAVWNWEHHQFPSAKWWPAIRDRLGMDTKWDSVIAEADRVKTGVHSSGLRTGSSGLGGGGAGGDRRDEPATAAAQAWQGWGTALKPAFEPIVVARKPLAGTVASNVLTHGTGALNIDANRVGTAGGTRAVADSAPNGLNDVYGPGMDGKPTDPDFVAGRWPTNVVLDESQAAVLDEQSGGASRFFYVAKAPKSERPVVDGVAHPTVKPLALMRYLVKLVTPPNGTVLDPFAGSGATLEAAEQGGFNSIGIEITPEYWPLIEARIERTV